ncbi:hypothetical protein [Actinospica robiniae]|uniref:hypothetical protein n=1 Tax=Actinospica robiniae TaxID=304901 RepID=UPI00042677F6|nr:hypothetical protein [Actinospica robiniae]
MTNASELLDRIRREPGIQAGLATVGEFDVNRLDPEPGAGVGSGAPLACVAGDFTGGGFFECGEPAAFRPILYVSSEGQAGLIADDLVAAVELFVGLPYWRDCLTYSGNGDLAVMTAAARFLQRDFLAGDADAAREQAELARALGLRVASADVLLGRLHAAVSRTDPDYVFSDSTGRYEGLFGPFTPDRNTSWR